MSKQTSMMSKAMPLMANMFANAESGRTWNVAISYAANSSLISPTNCKPLANKDSIVLSFDSRTAALIAACKMAKASAEKHNIVAKEGGTNGGWADWRTKDSQGKACYILAFPAPIADAEDIAVKAPVKAAQAPEATIAAPTAKAAKAAHNAAPAPETNSERRARAALEATQKKEADTKAAQEPKA